MHSPVNLLVAVREQLSKCLEDDQQTVDLIMPDNRANILKLWKMAIFHTPPSPSLFTTIVKTAHWDTLIPAMNSRSYTTCAHSSFCWYFQFSNIVWSNTTFTGERLNSERQHCTHGVYLCRIVRIFRINQVCQFRPNLWLPSTVSVSVLLCCLFETTETGALPSTWQATLHS